MENQNQDDQDDLVDVPRMGSIFGPGLLVGTLCEQQKELEFSIEKNETASNFQVPKANERAEDKKTENANFRTVSSGNPVTGFKKAGKSSAKKLAEKEGEISVEEALFSNHLLLQNIFKYSNFEDLKMCRQVNRLWKIEATKILWNNFTTEAIKVEGNEVSLGEPLKIKMKSSIVEFRNLIDCSVGFPCNNFIFPSNEFTEIGMDLLSVHGSLVKFVEFFGWGYVTPYDLIVVASKHLPNLEVLTSMDILDKAEPASLYENLQLKKLHSLHLTKFDVPIPVSFLAIIKKVALNLKNIYIEEARPSFYSLCLKNLMEVNLVPLLQNIQFIFDNNSLDVYEQLLKQNPKVKKIDSVRFEETFPPYDLLRLGKMLTKFFHQCSQTLTTISSLFSLGNVPGLRFPVCSKVTTLNVYDKAADFDTPLGQIPLFPATVLNFAQTFPTLRTVNFSYGGAYKVHFAEIFDKPTTPLYTVQVLDASACESEIILTSNIQHFCELFPNLKEAKFSLILEPAFEFIWNLKFLQKLQISLRIDDHVGSFPMWDSIFTGFSYEAVRDLYLSEDMDEILNFPKDEVEALRVKPSLVDLKYLTELTILLVHGHGPMWYAGITDEDYIHDVTSDDIVLFSSGVYGAVIEEDDDVVISHVARQFGFDMCPQLNSNVIIAFKNKYFFHMPPTKQLETENPSE